LFWCLLGLLLLDYFMIFLLYPVYHAVFVVKWSW
jgi:hypothetical protein